MALPAKISVDVSSYPKEVQGFIRMVIAEVYLLAETFEIYKIMFAESKIRVDRYNKHASVFFESFQLLLEDRLILGFTRLLDKDSSGNENLSLWNLLDKLHNESYVDFKNKHKKELETIFQEGEPLRMCRNKCLAHFDLAVSCGHKNIPLFGIELIQKLIHDVGSWLNKYSDNVCIKKNSYDFTGKGSATMIVSPIDHLIAKAEWVDQYDGKNINSMPEWTKFLLKT